MTNIKEYSLSNELKRKLGLLIKTTRTIKHKEYTGLIETNPYTKENFCKGICHYHTLTKVENEIVKEDMLYHIFLQKLDLFFQVEEEDHNKNMETIAQIFTNLIVANEYLNDTLLNEINGILYTHDYSADCIANLYIMLFKITGNLQKFNQTDFERDFKFIESNILLFEGVYSGMAYHFLGLQYLRTKSIEKAEEYLLKTRDIYSSYNVGKGIVNSNLINVYEYKKDYLQAVNICFEMEKFYIENKNYKRLIHTYNFLSYFFLMIRDLKSGEKYYNECMRIIDENNLERYKDIIQYNFGVYIYTNFGVKESEKYIIPAYEYCQLRDFKIVRKIVALFVMTLLEYDDNEIKEIVFNGLEDEKNEDNTNILKYFKYKYEKNGYHRKYALEKLIPYLKMKNMLDELLFIYEDLYA